MISFECPTCKTKLQVADQHAGKTIQCPKCKGKATAPASAEAQAITVMPVESVPPAPPPATAVTTPEQVPAAAPDRKRDYDDDREDRPRRRRDSDDSRKPAAAAGMGIGIIFLILGIFGCVGIGVLAVLVALFVPAVQKVREAAARTQSTNNLKQIALGFHSFHDANKRFPFNGADDKKQPGANYSKQAIGGNLNSGSWAFQILPFVDHAPTFQGVNRNAIVHSYMCPGRGRPPIETTNGGGAWSDYFYNNYINNPDQASKPDSVDVKRTLVSITDGSSNTIIVGHCNVSTTQYALDGNVTLSTNIFNGGTTGTMRSGNNGQKNPGGITLARDSAAAPGIGNWGGPFPQGGLMAMGDGTVRMFPYSMGNLGPFLTPNGAENVMLPDF